MSDNLNNQFRFALFANERVVTTTDGDQTIATISPYQAKGFEKSNLDQRDTIKATFYSVLGTVVAGATVSCNYYKRMSVFDSTGAALAVDKLLSTETKTLGAITVGNHETVTFVSADIEESDYFTVDIVLKEAVGDAYTVTASVTAKKKNNVAYQNEDATFEDLTVTGDLNVTGDMVLDDITSDNIEVNTLVINDEVTLPILTPINAVAADIDITVNAVPDAYVKNVNSVLTTALVGDNNDLTFTSKVLGVAGDYIEIVYTDPGAEGDLSVDLTGTGTAIDPYIIEVTLANDATPSITTTANDIITAIEGNVDANDVVNIILAQALGTGIVTALAQTPLASGVDEVLETTTLNSIVYVYYDAAGDDPTTEYPTYIPVQITAAVTTTADNLATAIATDTDMRSATAAGAVVTATWGTRGTSGNSIAFADGTGGDVTASPAMGGGVAGTPGMEGMTFFDGSCLWLCKADDYTETQYQWVNTNLARVFITAPDTKGGTAPSYVPVIISSHPYLVRKMLNATTNTVRFDINLSGISATSQMRFRFKYILAEATVPTSGETTIFTIGTATVTKVYPTGQVQNDIITTDWTLPIAQATTGLLTVTGTYAQLISIIDVEIEYTKA